MLILDSEKLYNFANTRISIIDQTYEEDIVDTAGVEDIPEFCILIPTVQDVGITNQMELYQPGEASMYLSTHGNPNPLAYGFGPNLIYEILSRGSSGVGVYSINLRGPSATMANVVVVCKYKVEENVAYTDENSNPYYVNADGELTTETVTDRPVIRDVLHVKFETTHIENCKKWADMFNGIESKLDTTPDEDGYRTVPVFGVMYRGATSYGNNIYFNMTPYVAEFDDQVYYRMSLFNGRRTVGGTQFFMFDMDSPTYDSSYYVDTVFNNKFATLRFISSNYCQDLANLVSAYLYTTDDFVNGTMGTPSGNFGDIDLFSANEFGVVVDEGSLNPKLTNAFQLAGGSDGDETRDELFEAFFGGQIIGDLKDPLRYKINYIPDIGYNEATKNSISDIVDARLHMTTATLLVGGNDGFMSAVVERQTKWGENHPGLRLLSKYQSPMAFDQWSRRTLTFPATYFDTIAMLNHFITNLNFYMPFAGFNARWSGYIEDTMNYPPSDNPEFINTLYKNRINVVMRDFTRGAYLSDQLMDVARVSDQIELNNEFLISNMLYDLVYLVHRNHFKFNEAREVIEFNNAVDDVINSKYKTFSASLTAVVQRVGTIGRTKGANKIIVTIDFRDINRYTDIELYLVEE